MADATSVLSIGSLRGEADVCGAAARRFRHRGYHDARVEDIVALGAMLDTDVRRPGWRTRLQRYGTWKDVGMFAFWSVAAIVVTSAYVSRLARFHWTPLPAASIRRSLGLTFGPAGRR